MIFARHNARGRFWGAIFVPGTSDLLHFPRTPNDRGDREMSMVVAT